MHFQAVAAPPRRLSPALRAWALQRFAMKLQPTMLAAIGVANLLGGIGLIKTYDATQGSPWMLAGGVAWIVTDLLLLGGLVAYIRTRGAMKGQKLVILLERGRIAEAQVLANKVDESVRINGAPRRVVALAIGGQELQLSTFDKSYASLFPPDAKLEVLYEPSVPDLVFPTSQVPAFAQETSAQRNGHSRSLRAAA